MKSIVFFALLLLIFHRGSSAYSQAVALELGFLSGAAYGSSVSIQTWSCSYCKKYPFVDAKVFSNSVGGIQGFTGYSQNLNAVVVAFRGSDNIQNWILNIGTTRSSYQLCSGCSVHTGFLVGYNFVSAAVKLAVQNLKAKYRTARLIVTGHSLGGAFAILCTAQLKIIYGNVDLTYTYGQPRVGNQAFASWFEANHVNTFRLIDYADIVPHVPPSNIGFVHNNRQIWYQRGMTSYAICDAESVQCANSIGVTSFSTDDHQLDNYLKLKGLQAEKGTFLERLIEKVYSFSSNLNLRNQESGSRYWADEEERKINQLLSKLIQAQSIKA